MLGMFGCWRMHVSISATTGNRVFDLMGMKMPVAACWAGGIFIVLALLCAVLFAGVEIKLGPLSRVSHNLIDHLIDTQAELGKVAWPGKDQIVNSTIAVLISVTLLAAFLFGLDYVFGALANLVFAR